MNTDRYSPFSAADPALGYLYQIRCALLWALQRQREQPDFLVSIETLDDVTFEDVDYTPVEILQTKHHRASTAALTDASSDLWKTLRIWFEGTTSGVIGPTTSLVLVTTSLAPDKSVASRLRNDDDRDVAAAVQTLDSVASSSINRANDAAYRAYLGATPSSRMALLERVVVLDGAPLASSLDAALKNEVHWAAGKDHHDAFLERLEG